MDSTVRHGGRLFSLGAFIIAVAAVISQGAALARDGDVVKTGTCTGASDWKLKLSPEDGRIGIEFEVDQDRVGKAWNVLIRKDGNVIWRGQKVTQAPSGSFTSRKLTRNGAGYEVIVGRATNPATGEVCRGRATFSA